MKLPLTFRSITFILTHYTLHSENTHPSQALKNELALQFFPQIAGIFLSYVKCCHRF